MCRWEGSINNVSEGLHYIVVCNWDKLWLQSNKLLMTLRVADMVIFPKEILSNNEKT